MKTTECPFLGAFCIIPDICLFWYASAYLGLLKVLQKVRKAKKVKSQLGPPLNHKKSVWNVFAYSRPSLSPKLSWQTNTLKDTKEKTIDKAKSNFAKKYCKNNYNISNPS